MTRFHSVDTAIMSRPAAPAAVQADLIFDVGLNIGQDTAFYLSQGYRVLAIEADPTLAEAARVRFHHFLRTGQLEILNVGIAEADGSADFWICDGKPQFNSFHREIAARDSYPHHAIQVPTMRFSRVLERYGIPYFLKIDIEGNDMLCLDHLSSSMLPKYLSVESECPLDGRSAGVDDGLRVLRKLAGLGYRKFKLVDQYTFCGLSLPPQPHYRLDAAAQRVFCRAPLNKVRGCGLVSRFLLMRRRLERRFGCVFPMGSSGPWGEETPGRWLGQNQAEEAYIFYRRRHFKAREMTFHSFWCDWHAKE